MLFGYDVPTGWGTPVYRDVYGPPVDCGGCTSPASLLFTATPATLESVDVATTPTVASALIFTSLPVRASTEVGGAR